MTLSILVLLVFGLVAPSWGLTRDERIAAGEVLFFTETFGGNGRTCATCHPPNFNTKLDVEDIALLSPDNPLFQDTLMDVALLRSHALILTHHDGFDKPPTFRSIPDLFGSYRKNKLGKVIFALDPTAEAFQIKETIKAAVRDHLSKSLERVEGQDFREPTRREQNFLKAFIVSLRPILKYP